MLWLCVCVCETNYKECGIVWGWGEGDSDKVRKNAKYGSERMRRTRTISRMRRK